MRTGVNLFVLSWRAFAWFYPKQTGDPGRDRNARTVQFACLLLASAVSAVAILNVLAGTAGDMPLLIFAIAGLMAAMIVNRAGRWDWAARAAVSSLLLTALLLVFEAHDGFRSLSMLMFPGMLLIAVMLLDRTSYAITATLVLAAVAAIGVAERQGLTRAIPGVRSRTTYESIFFVDLHLLMFALIGSRIARDAQNNVSELRATIDRVSKANLDLSKAAEALRASQQQLVSIYNTVRDVIFHLAVESAGQYRIVSVNASFSRVTGLSPESVVGKTVDEVIPKASLKLVLEKYRQAVEEKTVVSWEETSDYPAGRLTGEVSVVPVFNHEGTCTHLIGSVHDITERKRAEEERERLRAQLAHSQKLESIGRLAGGIAHDFNNLMSAVLLNADSALDELSSEQPAVESVTAIRDTAEKAVSIGRQLMAFSSKQALQTEVVDLNNIVTHCIEAVRRSVGKKAEVSVRTSSRPALVDADRGQLEQLLMNLALNSRDAMPDGGTFAIEISVVDLRPTDAELSPDAHPGSYVRLAVSDTGVGMDRATQARIFEPFFTTKSVGKGTGLGLSVVYGIVKQSGGFIDVASEPGKGAAFKIYLPLVSKASNAAISGEETPIQGGTETILLVEDEAAVREKVRGVLAKAGYLVLAAPDGDNAYQIALQETRPIDLLLTDVVMPGVSGPCLAERLAVLRPGIRILYTSGYPTANEECIDLKALTNFIQKPFTKEQLLRKVRGVLDSD